MMFDLQGNAQTDNLGVEINNSGNINVQTQTGSVVSIDNLPSVFPSNQIPINGFTVPTGNGSASINGVQRVCIANDNDNVPVSVNNLPIPLPVNVQNTELDVNVTNSEIVVSLLNATKIKETLIPVSYTHLTLPTILLV